MSFLSFEALAKTEQAHLLKLSFLHKAGFQIQCCQPLFQFHEALDQASSDKMNLLLLDIYFFTLTLSASQYWSIHYLRSG